MTTKILPSMFAAVVLVVVAGWHRFGSAIERWRPE
jgi:hypothetical protein